MNCDCDKCVLQVWEGHWRVIPFHVLPEWLKDNDYLLHGHRPPMPSFRACFGSIFRIHTETGNIWTHLLGGIKFFTWENVLQSRVCHLHFCSPPPQGWSYSFVWAHWLCWGPTCISWPRCKRKWCSGCSSWGLYSASASLGSFIPSTAILRRCLELSPSKFSNQSAIKSMHRY